MIHRGRVAAALAAWIAPGLPVVPGPVTIGLADDAPAILTTR